MISNIRQVSSAIELKFVRKTTFRPCRCAHNFAVCLDTKFLVLLPMYHPTAGLLPSSRSQFPLYSPATLGVPRPEGSNSHSPSVSPLVTPNGTFDTLRNLSPPLHTPPGNRYAQYMMPMQHVELLQQSAQMILLVFGGTCAV
jgi:hypothetical protein